MLSSQSFAQEKKRLIRLGLNYGIGTQQIFPYNSTDYNYDIKGVKAQINYPLRKARVISFEFQLEPALYFAKHQLLNEFFVQPKDGVDYLAQREIFIKEKIITEYALNIGLLIRYNPGNRFSVFILGSLGPMHSNTATERLAKGFAFSDIIAIGLAYKVRNIVFEIKPGLRHVSNADLKYPNSGHNSSNIDLCISFFL